MNTGVRALVMGVLCASLGAAGFRVAFAETPGEIPKPWTYEGSMKLQQQEQEQMRQQQAQQGGQQPQAYPGRPQVMPGGGAAGAALEAARRDWLKRPALPPDRNPLLGVKWTRPASAGTNSSDPFAGLLALAKGGLCEVLFGGGFFEFRTDTLVGYDQRTREQELDRVEYRGDARHVVVIPRTTIRLMEFDVEGPNRINWTSQNCALVRAGAASAGTATAQSTPTAGSGQAMAPAGAGKQPGSVLSLSVSSTSSGGSNVGGRALWVLSKDAQVALTEAGLQSTPGRTALQSWMLACQSRLPACQQGAKALKTYTIGIATTDASGHAQSPPLPAARYWVLSDAKVGSRHVMWNEPVDLKGGPASIRLDDRNAMAVD
jgi:hypothetical protein